MGTPSKWYKEYNDRITGKTDRKNLEYKLREEHDMHRRELCEAKQEAAMLKNKLEGFMHSICDRHVYNYPGGCEAYEYRTPTGYGTEVFQIQMAVSREVKEQLLCNETMLRDFLRYNIERGVRDIMKGNCERW